MRFIDVNEDSKVDKYNKLLRDNHVIVLFYMDGCGACEALKPHWNEFEKELRSKKDKHDNIVIAKVNSRYMNDISGYKSILGYPTIYHLHNGEKISEFSDKRTVSALNKYLNNIKSHAKKGGRRRVKRNRRSSRKSVNKSKSRKGRSRRKPRRKTRKHK